MRVRRVQGLVAAVVWLVGVDVSAQPPAVDVAQRWVASASAGVASGALARPNPAADVDVFGQDDARDADVFGQDDARDAAIFGSDDDARDDDVFGSDDDARDADVFGQDDDAHTDTGPGGGREDALFGEGAQPSSGQRLSDRLTELEDPLAIGGQLYARQQLTHQQDTNVEDDPFSAPMLFDLYLDGRPNDRVRAFVRGRLRHDATVVDGETDRLGRTASATTVDLDQLWLKFDVERAVYVTIGRQPIRWGTGRFWNPSDFLNAQARDPLAVFDERLGVGLVKLHFPLESIDANLYAVANVEDAADLTHVGGAVRGELLLGLTELALTAAARRDDAVRLGADVSTGLWLFDVRVEGALTHGERHRYWQGELDLARFRFPTELDREDDWIPRVVAGAELSVRYSDEDTVTFGAEYAYDDAGYDDASLLPWVIFNGDWQPLHFGRHYGALYAALMAPGSWNDTSFILSALGNLSDRSFLTRFDARVRVLTYLDLAFWTSVYAGDGELRPSIELEPFAAVPQLEHGLVVEPPMFELGLGAILRF